MENPQNQSLLNININYSTFHQKLLALSNQSVSRLLSTGPSTIDPNPLDQKIAIEPLPVPLTQSQKICT